LANLNISDSDHRLVRSAVEILGSHMECFRAISLMSASLTPEEDDYPAGSNTMFFKSFLDPRIQRHLHGSTHLFWMEHDVTPIRPGWVDALLHETTKRPFWMKGSPYRGDGLDATATDPKHWNWVGHINGNALYNLRDPAFLAFLRLVVQYEPPAHFWKPFDMSIWRVLHAFPYTWPLHQQHRSKFIYADFIHHWGFNVTPADYAYARARPGVFLLHGANSSAGNWRRAPKPRPPGLVWTDKVRPPFVSCGPALCGPALPVHTSTWPRVDRQGRSRLTRLTCGPTRPGRLLRSAPRSSTGDGPAPHDSDAIRRQRIS
jgi:hypothetical protein